MSRLMLVRHGESIWNALHKLQGQKDLPLSEKGRTQAQHLATVVGFYTPDAVIASDLTRAKETAALLGYPDVPTDIAWRESYLGDWEGASIPTLRLEQKANYQAWRDGIYNPPNAETFLEFTNRIREAIACVKEQQKNMLVVTHGGVVRTAMRVLFGIEPSKIIPVSPASLTIIDLEPEPRLRAYNITSYEAMLDPPD